MLSTANKSYYNYIEHKLGDWGLCFNPHHLFMDITPINLVISYI